METSKARFEEFASTSWTGPIIAVLLVLALSGALAQHVAHPSHPPLSHPAAVAAK